MYKIWNMFWVAQVSYFVQFMQLYTFTYDVDYSSSIKNTHEPAHESLVVITYTVKLPLIVISDVISRANTPASKLGYLAPPRHFFMGAKLIIGTPWMRNDVVY